MPRGRRGELGSSTWKRLGARIVLVVAVFMAASCTESEPGEQDRAEVDPTESSEVDAAPNLRFVGTIPVLDGVADRESSLTAVSPDGRWVAVRDIRTDEWCIQPLSEAETGGPCVVNPEFGGRIGWAPDSSRILSQGAPITIFGDPDVWSLSVDGAHVNHTDDGIPVEGSGADEQDSPLDVRSTVVGDDIVFVRFHQQQATVETTPIEGGGTSTVAGLDASVELLDFLEPEGTDVVWTSVTATDDGSSRLVRVDLVDGTVQNVRANPAALPTSGGASPDAGLLLGPRPFRPRSTSVDLSWSLHHPDRAPVPIVRDGHAAAAMRLSPEGTHIAALFAERDDQQERPTRWLISTTEVTDVLAGSPTWTDTPLPDSFTDVLDERRVVPPSSQATNPLTWTPDERILIDLIHHVGVIETDRTGP